RDGLLPGAPRRRLSADDADLAHPVDVAVVQQQQRVVADHAQRLGDDQAAAEAVGAGGEVDGGAGGGGVDGGLERAGIVGHPVALGAEISHLHGRRRVGDRQGRDDGQVDGVGGGVGALEHNVNAARTGERVVAGAADQLVLAGATGEAVVAVAAVDQVGTGAAVDDVVAGTGDDEGRGGKGLGDADAVDPATARNPDRRHEIARNGSIHAVGDGGEVLAA